MGDIVGIVDIVIITIGIPFIMAITSWLLKHHLNLKADLRMLEIDLNEYKKLSNSKKNQILKEIAIIKHNQRKGK